MSDGRMRWVAERVASILAQERERAEEEGIEGIAPTPGAEVLEEILEVGFWSSLRREEGNSPRISLAYLGMDDARFAMQLARPIPFSSETLTRLAPAVERPGIHLGVWPEEGRLRVWGATRSVPPLCLVLEVVEPGLLVVKRQRREGFGKFANVAVIRGEEVKLIAEPAGMRIEAFAESLLAWREREGGIHGAEVLLQLAASMRAHGKGGTLLIVPHGSEVWRESIVAPITYRVDPAYGRIRDLLRQELDGLSDPGWRDALRQAVEGLAGLTAVDGATVVTDRFEILAFGAKIGRREGHGAVEELVVLEPVEDDVAQRRHPLEIGGTRHLSAAQFAQDQRDSLALVASQDGRFTSFSWSLEWGLVAANRVEVLLL